MLDACWSVAEIPICRGCWMLVEDPVFSGDIQECSNSEVQKHPVLLRRINIQNPESSIQNQPILAMVFVVTA